MSSQSLKRCPDCGEAYAPSYKRCPFCEEEAAFQEGEHIYKKNKHRGGKRPSSSYSLVTPTLLVLIVLMAALLVYLLFGDQIADKFKGEESPVTPPASSEVSDPDGPSSAIEPVEPTVDDPVSSAEPVPDDDPGIATPSVVSYDVVDALPSGLSLNKTDFTMSVGDDDVQLKVTSGSGTYTWVSQDPDVATVDEDGLVKAVSSGMVNVLVSDGSRKGVCIVRVRGGSGGGSSSGAALNKTDYTTHVGDMDVLLTLGVTDGVTWETSDASVATVNKGLVHAVGQGSCTITATHEGKSYTCIVRVAG